MTRRSRHILVAVLMLLGLAGCGQMGPLYLPDNLPAEPASEGDQGDEQDE
ncbi:MAG TPA: lipoprotein [Gammaproteobacteria bacterium]|nr:lipoprotein [Gammaproteobacteria bacterium]